MVNLINGFYDYFAPKQLVKLLAQNDDPGLSDKEVSRGTRGVGGGGSQQGPTKLKKDLSDKWSLGKHPQTTIGPKRRIQI